MYDTLFAVAQQTPKLLGGFRFPLLTGVIALVISWLLTPWVRSIAIKRGAVDDPKSDERRVHKEPTPRWGGLAIYAGIALAICAVLPFAFPTTVPFPRYLIGMLVIGAAIVVVGALDDLHQYKAKVQALFLLGAGVAVQYFYSDIGRVQIQSLGIPFAGVWVLGAFAVPLTAIYIFVVSKTMDTIDGIDGLAAGIATIAASTLTVIAVYQGQPRVAIVAAAVAGASIGFLKHNYNPAKIFMGTGGAQLLGFMLACLSIVGAFKTLTAVAIVVPIFVFGIPLVDAVQVVIRRRLSGAPITQADKRHLHHALLGRGLSQRQAVWVLYIAAAALCGTLLLIIRNYV